MGLLLTYAQWFHRHQFITRRTANSRILNRLEDLLTDSFQGDTVARHGPPTVRYMAKSLNISPNYLSELFAVLTGQSPRQHIHDRLIEKRAKEELSSLP